jgi:DNA-binding transcriptional LysR family regulator
LPIDAPVPRGRLTLAAVARFGLVLPPETNPLRLEIETAASEAGLSLDVVVEVEGIRLIADLVAAGAGASVLPLTAVPPELTNIRVVPIADIRPRRLALANQRDAHLSLADRAVRDSLRRLVTRQPAHGPSAFTRKKALVS